MAQGSLRPVVADRAASAGAHAENRHARTDRPHVWRAFHHVQTRYRGARGRVQRRRNMTDAPSASGGTPLHELSINRFIAASPEIVWRAWTERLEEWWAPKPWTTKIIEQD